MNEDDESPNATSTKHIEKRRRKTAGLINRPLVVPPPIRAAVAVVHGGGKAEEVGVDIREV